MAYTRLKILPILFSLSLMVSCSFAQKGNPLSPKEFSKSMAAAPDAQLIDVRTPEEYDEVHIDDAMNIDWNGDNFEEEAGTLDKTKPVYVYCRSGKRSAAAAEKMRAMGFTTVYDLRGGILAWEQSGLLKQKEKESGKEEKEEKKPKKNSKEENEEE